MVIEKKYNKYNHNPGGDNKWKKNKERKEWKNFKKISLTIKPYKSLNIGNNWKKKKLKDLEIWKLPSKILMDNNLMKNSIKTNKKEIFKLKKN